MLLGRPFGTRVSMDRATSFGVGWRCIGPIEHSARPARARLREVRTKRWIWRSCGRLRRIDRFTRNGWPDRPGHAGPGQARGADSQEREAELSMDYVLGTVRAPRRAETATS